MKKIIFSIIATTLFLCTATTSAMAENPKIKSYGHFKKMVHMKKTAGVVKLQKAIPALNGYAVIRCGVYQPHGKIQLRSLALMLKFDNTG